MSPAGYKPKMATGKYRTVKFWSALAESRANQLHDTLARLEQTERKLAWACGIMVVGGGILGGLLLAVLTR